MSDDYKQKYLKYKNKYIELNKKFVKIPFKLDRKLIKKNILKRDTQTITCLHIDILEKFILYVSNCMLGIATCVFNDSVIFFRFRSCWWCGTVQPQQQRQTDVRCSRPRSAASRSFCADLFEDHSNPGIKESFRSVDDAAVDP